MGDSSYRQEPVAIIGFACRLPGGNNNPTKLWQFLERGGIASNKVPKSRFNIDGHRDGSLKPKTMRPLGGMFLEDVDPADFDASFFEISKVEAISMDPNQRQMLEVVFEGLENAGVPLDKLEGAPVGCFVGSFASDYADMQTRDPEDRPANITVGAGRAILSNRLSHFLNIKGPSMTIDTACSGSMIAIDVACRYLQSREIDMGIISTSNLYLNPEHVMDDGAVGNAHSPTGLCHTFDISADGYVKAEAVSAIIIKRLSDALRDGDPIRSVIVGSANNSDGRTPGIASPSSEAQAAAIRSAYANAGITNFNETTYLECHGTGTQAGDPTEVGGAGSVFSATRDADKPLMIGSIKSNVGHAEPAAGISGLIKTTMAMEKGVIPGNPTFENPSPKIDFAGWKVKASRTAVPWPACAVKRASVNSFGYGGSNVHVILQQAPALQHVSSYISDDDDFELDSEEAERPSLLVLSANDDVSLRANIKNLTTHLINPRVKIDLADLAFTLSERRSKFFRRAFVTTKSTEFDTTAFTIGKKKPETPRIGFIFTGQGAQWPQMGKALLSYFPKTRLILQELDSVLQALPDAPKWSLIDELVEPRTADHLRQPEFSQPLVTALQICLISVLESWGITPQGVVGHSSGEIAAAYAAGYLSSADAIKAAFYRGRAALNCQEAAEKDVGMLAVGLGTEAVTPFIEKHQGDAWIACFNSPSSVTVSGRRPALEALKTEISEAGHFARLLQVDLAYHSKLMDAIGVEYERLLESDFNPLASSSKATMYSSVLGAKMDGKADALYWKTNMVSPVRFDGALKAMLEDSNAPNFLIEIGPSGALAGPTSQVKKSLPGQGADISYCAAWARGQDAGKAIFDAAGHLFVAGGAVKMDRVNEYDLEGAVKKPRSIVDLPNYEWNHSIKYWHENASSKDWRFKKYVNHDLLGSKVLGTSWTTPTWRKTLNLADVPWLKDHKMGSDVLMPGSGYITMALEALFQKTKALDPAGDQSELSPNDLCYRFRNTRFKKALVLEEGNQSTILLTLSQRPGSEAWHEFHISSVNGDSEFEHCSGMIRVQEPVEESADEAKLAPLQYTTPGKMWYRAQEAIGYGFGPSFQKLLTVESRSGQRNCRSHVALEEPKSKWDPQSYYPIHPASLDGCFQTVTPSLWAGERSSLNSVLVPSIIDDVIINKVPKNLGQGVSVANSEYTGRGRLEEAKSYCSNCSVYAPDGSLIMRMAGLHFAKLDTGKQEDPHVFSQVSWKPDISFLDQEQIAQLPVTSSVEKLNLVVDLVAHKKPLLRVLELNFNPVDLPSLWLDSGDAASRASYAKFHYASIDASSLVSFEQAHNNKRDASFSLIQREHERLGLDESLYDLVIVKAPAEMENTLQSISQAVKSILARDSYTLVVKQTHALSDSDSATPEDSHANTSTPGTPENIASTPGTPLSSTSDSETKKQVTENMIPSIGSSMSPPKIPLGAADEQFLAFAQTLGSTIQVTSDSAALVYLSKTTDTESSATRRKSLILASLSEKTPSASQTLKDGLVAEGWNISEETYPFNAVTDGSVVLILDELSSPIMTSFESSQWDALKHLVSTGAVILWVTQGAQYQVSNPDTALAHGLFRVIRMEDMNAKLVCLDVQSSSGSVTDTAITQVLDSLRGDWPKDNVETEFSERGGLIHVHRLTPDDLINDFKMKEAEGAEPVSQWLQANERPVSLRVGRLGTFQSLTWCETATSQVPVKVGTVEVEIKAVGVNFKDVAVTMGIVPENEYTIGYEAAGIVSRLGPGVTKFKVGDRVCFLNNGSYANRLQVPMGRAHVIPDTMSFEDAATIPAVYLASIYSLFDIANLKKGQSVLIHSAAGGVGISAIQLAQYVGAEIYVTVGTEEKRDFLAKEYGIPRSRMFSSRDTSFAKEILKATGGRGVDVILNSLMGEMLDESWRICADGGTMVEIGKKDIVDRNTLSMEPFDRNCSFRAMDFSYTKDISDPLIERLLGQIFDLVNAGHIGPVHPVTTFGFDQVASALAYVRGGKHIGKVIVSNGDNKDVQVPIRQAQSQLALRPDVSYLIVGGLKGLCGNLAIHMARHGARHIIVCSRSGISDEQSVKTVLNCEAYGCKVTHAKGDVGDEAFMRTVFKDASPAIAGVIQGAMVLRDKPYETMTLEEYHAAIYGKVRGTWNLHKVSQEQSQPLDFFTLLSSISGIVGKRGQSNYSAGNTFLDAFAHYRQSLGLRANAVDLGLIEDVGYIAEQGGMDSHFDRTQWEPIYEGTLRKILTYSVLQQTEPINRDTAAQLVTGITFPLPEHSDLIREARFGHFFVQSASGGASKESDQGNQTVRMLLMMHKTKTDQPGQVKLALELLITQLTKILRLETEMEPAKPLLAYGLDSLAAVELRNWIRVELGAQLTTLDITNSSSLIALAEKLISKIPEAAASA